MYARVARLALLLAALSAPAFAQAPRWTVSMRGVMGYYGGERLGNVGGPVAEFRETAEPSFGVEAGRWLRPDLTVGAFYLPGRFPYILSPAPWGGHAAIRPGASSDWVHLVGVVGRWRPVRLGPVAPYVQGGVAGAFTRLNDRVRAGVGPRVGGGVEVHAAGGVHLFAEADGVAVLPDATADLAGSDRYDLLTFVGAGIRLRLGAARRAPVSPRLGGIQGTTALLVGEEGLFAADVQPGDAAEPILYTWTFGDGSTAGDRVASHAYVAPGAYTVTFSAYAGDVVLRDSMRVVVTEPERAPEVLAVLTEPLVVRAREPVRFVPTIEGTPPLTCVWDFGDGQTAVGCSPEHTYTEASTYAVRLEVINGAGKATRSRDVEVRSNLCADLPVLADVYFEPNSAELSVYARAVLRTNLEVLVGCPSTSLVVTGYTTPDEDDAAGLATARAEAVADYYGTFGIQEGRLRTVGAGLHPGIEPGLAAWQFRTAATRLVTE